MNTTHRLWALAAAVSVVMVVVPLASCGSPKGKCTPTSCFGCCDANDQCQAGTTTTACGTSAGMCTSCAFGSICSFGVCNNGGTGGNGGNGGGTGGGSGGGTTGGGTGGGTTGGGTGGGTTGGGTGGGTTGGGTGGGTTGGGTGGGPTGGGGGASLPGDTCATAQTMMAFVNNTATFTGTTAGYTHDLTSSCANPFQPDRVILFTQPSTGEMTFRLVTTGFAPALSVHLYSSGACGQEYYCGASSVVGATIDHTQIVPAGTYAIVIDSKGTGGGAFTLTATRVVATVDAGPPPPTTVLQNNVSVSVSGSMGSIQNFSITVPSGAPTLTFTTTGTSGDVDIYAEFNALPDPANTDYFSEQTGSADESIVIPTPPAGVWYVTLKGYSAYSGGSLTASY